MSLVIDADVHLSPLPEGGCGIGPAEALKRMERSQVDQTLVWLQPPYLRHIDAANKFVRDAVRNYPGKFLGFGWADPRLGVDAAKSLVKKCVNEYGFYGVKLNGAQNDFYIDDPVLSLPVVEEIARTGKVIAFHTGADAYEQTHPFRVGKIARLFPELKILMVHMGGVGFHDLSRAAIEIAEQHPNITLIGSAVRAVNILAAIKKLGARRVCFGSDTPFALMHVEKAMYEALLDGEVSPADRALVMGQNIARVLGLAE